MADTPIQLPVGASAEKDTCGSCRFFSRLFYSDYGPSYASRGRCGFRWPPMHQRFQLKELTEADCDWAPDTVQDTFSCDCYQHDGKRYIVQRLVE
jgi:hypothetical protein